MRQFFRKRRFFDDLWPVVWLLVLVLVLFSNSLHNPFFFDDIHKILKNSDFVDFGSNPFQFLFHTYGDVKRLNVSDPSRPLVYGTYFLLLRVFGPNPFYFHLVNTLIHFLNSVLVYLLTQRLFASEEKGTGVGADRIQKTRLAVMVATFFCVLPIQAGTVIYIYALSDLLSSFFIFLCLYFYTHPVKSSRNIFLTLVSFVLALMSKQVAVAVPLVLLFYDFLFRGKVRSRFLSLLLFVDLAYLGWRFIRLGGVGDLEAQNLIPQGTYLQHQGLTILRYLILTLFPVGLTVDHFIDPQTSLWVTNLLAWLGLMFAVFFFWKANSFIKQGNLSRFGAAFFFVMLLPTSSFFPTTDLMVERRVYLANFGFVLALAALPPVVRIFQRRFWRMVLVCVFIGYCALDVYRNHIFSEPLSIWNEALARNQSSPKALTMVGLSLFELGKYDQALGYYQEAVRFDPNYSFARNNLGLVLAARGRTQEAASQYHEALRINPDYTDAHYNLGILLASQGQVAKAIFEYEQTLRIDPSYANAYNNLGVLFAQNGMQEKAILQYMQAIRIKPSYVDAHFNLGLALAALGRSQDSAHHFLEVLRLVPEHESAKRNLEIVRKGIGVEPKP